MRRRLEDEKEVSLKEEHSIIIRILNRTRYATKDEIIEVFTRSIILFTRTKDNDMVRQYVTESTTYILGIRDDITEKELIEIAGKISEEGGELVMTAAERLREEGMKKGMELGKLKRDKEIAMTCIIKGYDTSVIMDITGLTENDIEEVRKEMLNKK